MNSTAFLDEIRSDPEDVIARLVYADWLEEQGDPVAELIRVQCELIETPLDSPRRPELVQLEHELLQQYREQWIEPLRKFDVRGVEVRRGFIEAIRMDAEVFIAGASEIVQMLPALCSLNLRKSKKLIAEVAQVPELEQVRFLDLRLAGLENRDLKVLLKSPYLTNLADLNVQGNRFTMTGAREIARCPKLTRLRALSVAANPIGRKGFAALLDSGNLQNVKWLSAWNCGLTGECLGDFGRSSGMPNLEFLDVSANKLSKSIKGFEDGTRPLRFLKLHRTSLGPQNVRRLADASSLAGLTELQMANSDIGVDGIARLIESPHLENLQVWNVSHVAGSRISTPVSFTDDALHSRLRKLSRLDLTNNGLGNGAFETLARAGCLQNVEELLLSHTKLGDDGLAAILNSGMDRLRVLEIYNTEVTSKSLLNLAAWKGLTQLHRLTVPDETLKKPASVARYFDAAEKAGLKANVGYTWGGSMQDSRSVVERRLRKYLEKDRFQRLFEWP